MEKLQRVSLVCLCEFCVVLRFEPTVIVVGIDFVIGNGTSL